MTGIIHNYSRETIVAATIIGSITALGAFLYQRRKRYGVPTKWVPIGKVKNLYIYPLKSGRRIELKNAICTEFGLIIPKSEDKNLYQFRDRLVNLNFVTFIFKFLLCFSVLLEI